LQHIDSVGEPPAQRERAAERQRDLAAPRPVRSRCQSFFQVTDGGSRRWAGCPA
jgi:hypothetical protein